MSGGGPPLRRARSRPHGIGCPSRWPGLRLIEVTHAAPAGWLWLRPYPGAGARARRLSEQLQAIQSLNEHAPTVASSPSDVLALRPICHLWWLTRKDMLPKGHR